MLTQSPALGRVLPALVENISLSKNLYILCLEDLRLSDLFLDALSTALARSRSIKELYVNNCALDSRQLQRLCPGLCEN